MLHITGASFVQLYTSLAYDGPNVIHQLKSELVDCLKKDGFRNVEQAVGADHSKVHKTR